MKKRAIIQIFVATVLVVTALLIAVSCNSSNGGGKIGEHYVEIKDISVTKNQWDVYILTVTYSFTNGSDSAASFWPSISHTVYQNGVALTPTSAISDSEQVDIKPGSTYDVEICYSLKEATGDIEIELSHWGMDVKTKTFTLPEETN